MKVKKIESYPPLTIDEQETVLTWDAKERAWHICTDYPAHARKYEAVLDESKPVKKRRYSDEQRAKMAERLKAAREKVTKDE